MTKVFTIAHVPDDLTHAWLQHMRDFDTAHPGCHFEVAAEAPNATLAEVIRTLQINPSLDFSMIFEREVERNAANPGPMEIARAYEEAQQIERFLGYSEGGEVFDAATFVRETLEALNAQAKKKPARGGPE